MTGADRRLAVGAALLVSALLAVDLGHTDLWPPDEPRVAAVSREMLAEGNWLVPRLNGEPFLEEPPLFYWLQAGSYRIAGAPSAVAARLPAAAAAIAGVGVTAALASALGASAGIAALVLATAPEYWWMARAATPDAANAAATALALTLFFLAWRSGRRAFLAGAVVAAGTAFWLKSLLGVGLAGLVATVFVVVAGRGRLARRDLLLAVGAVAAIAAAWVGMLWLVEGGGAVSFFLVTNHLGRLVGARSHGHGRPILYYLPNLALGLLPWSVVVPAALALAWRERADPARQFPLVWAATIVLALSAAAGKRPHYPLAAYPAFAVLVAQWWPGAIARGLGRVTSAVLSAILLIACPAAAVLLLELRPGPLLAAADAAPRHAATWLAVVLPASVRASTWLAAALAIGTALLFVGGRRARSALGTAVAVAACVTIVHLVLTLVVLPRFDPFCSARPLAARLDAAAAGGVPVVTFGFHNREKLSPLLFYTGRRLPEVPDGERLADLLRSGPACALMTPQAYAGLPRALPGVPVQAGRLRLVVVAGAGGCPATAGAHS